LLGLGKAVLYLEHAVAQNRKFSDVGGHVRKYSREGTGLDMKRLKAMVDESRGHLFNAVGYRPDIFAELLPKLG
jgi:hypothetical protein